MWAAVQYVVSGLSLVAFVVAALAAAYRARLKARAEIIRSASGEAGVEAIATEARFFRVNVSGLTRNQQREIVLAQIEAGARHEQRVINAILIIASLLAIVAVISIVINPISASTSYSLDKKSSGQEMPLHHDINFTALLAEHKSNNDELKHLKTQIEENDTEVTETNKGLERHAGQIAAQQLRLDRGEGSQRDREDAIAAIGEAKAVDADAKANIARWEKVKARALARIGQLEQRNKEISSVLRASSENVDRPFQ